MKSLPSWVRGLGLCLGLFGLAAPVKGAEPVARLERYEAVIELGKAGEVTGEVTLELTAMRELERLAVTLGPQAQVTVLAPPSPAVVLEGEALRLARPLAPGERLEVKLSLSGVAVRPLGKEIFCGLWEDPWLPRLPGASDPGSLMVSFALPKGRRTDWKLASFGTRSLDEGKPGQGRLDYRAGVQGLALCYGRLHLVRQLASPAFVAFLDRPLAQGLPLSASGASATQAGGMARVHDGGQGTSSPNSSAVRSEQEAYREGFSRSGSGSSWEIASAGGSVSRLPTPASPRMLRGGQKVGREAAFLAQARWSVEWLSQLLGPRKGGRVALVLADPDEGGGSGVGLVALPRKEILDPQAPLRPFRNEAQLYYEMARQWWPPSEAGPATDAWLVEGLPVVLAAMLAEADEGPAAAKAIESIVSERLAMVSAGAPAPAREQGARVLQELRARLFRAAEPPSDRAFLTLLRRLHERGQQGSLGTPDLLAVLSTLRADGLTVPVELATWLTSRLANEAPGAGP